MSTNDRTNAGMLQEHIAIDSYEEKTIVDVFERQARDFPDKTALIFKNETVSYQQLNERANKLAVYLRQTGVGKETFTGICLGQSIEKVITMLAVLKAGGTYIPLDPDYPENRISFILKDTGAPFLITDSSFIGKLAEYSEHLICLDKATVQEDITKQPIDNPEKISDDGDLAYIIYTSGSTGTPKGVLIEHGSVKAFTDYHGRVLGITAGSSALQFSSTSFDAAVIDLWIPLLCGATLYLYPNNKIIGAPLFDFIRQHKIDVIPLISPTVLSSLPVTNDIGHLAVIGIGGEACPAHTLQHWCNKVKLLNAYGPTEATVAVTSFICNEHYTAKTIGKAYESVELFILDGHLNEVEDGTPGELFIGGIQVARGYLNRPEITSERFIPNPFVHNLNDRLFTGRLYRTGDLVKRLPDGNLEFVGRADDQVKIRGYRIELGEIESVVNQLGGIRQAVVLPRESSHGHTLLAAFVVPENVPGEGGAILTQEWRQQLRSALPAYMVPDIFELLEEMPVNVHGKVDKQQLQITGKMTEKAEVYENITSEDYEAVIKAVWAKYLHHDDIQEDDDFFLSGGHSLLLVQVYSSFPQQLSRHLQIPDLYAYPTIHSLAEEIRAREKATILSDKEKEQAIIHELLEDAKLSIELNITTQPNPDVLTTPQYIFLTGATGFVGAHLLAELLVQMDATIYCLVRAENTDKAMARLRQTFDKFRLPWNSAHESRILPVTGDLSLPGFGASTDLYDEVAANTEIIYHSGSSVSYLQPYPVIKGSNIDGLQEIIKLATTGKMKYLALLSSMGVFSWGRPFTGKTWMNEEDSIEQNLGAVSRDLGYIKSKWVMEKMVQEAIAKGLQVINFRLGFAVCSSQTGATVMNQWWGSLVRSCVEVGAFPLVMGLKDELTTVDYMAKAIVHIAQNQEAVGKNFHLSPNPENDVSLTDFFAKMNEYYGMNLVGLPYHEWLDMWKENRSNPLYPLLSLFTDDVHEGKSLVEAYENTYYYDRTNTRNFLRNSTLTPPVFDKTLMTPYLQYMDILP